MALVLPVSSGVIPEHWRTRVLVRERRCSPPGERSPNFISDLRHRPLSVVCRAARHASTQGSVALRHTFGPACFITGISLFGTSVSPGSAGRLCSRGRAIAARGVPPGTGADRVCESAHAERPEAPRVARRSWPDRSRTRFAGSRCVDFDEAALEADPGDGKASGADRLGDRVDTPQTSGARRADVPGDRDRASQCPDLVVAVEQQRPPSGVIPKRWRSRMCSSTAVQPSASSR
jgi:hypothetical protein